MKNHGKIFSLQKQNIGQKWLQSVSQHYPSSNAIIISEKYIGITRVVPEVPDLSKKTQKIWK